MGLDGFLSISYQRRNYLPLYQLQMLSRVEGDERSTAGDIFVKIRRLLAVSCFSLLFQIFASVNELK
jgi:hypothetical protein